MTSPEDRAFKKLTGTLKVGDICITHHRCPGGSSCPAAVRVKLILEPRPGEYRCIIVNRDEHNCRYSDFTLVGDDFDMYRTKEDLSYE